MLDSLIVLFSDYGYFAVFGMLLLCGFGLPVPEDITLVAGGVMSGLACPESNDFWSAIDRCRGVHIMLVVSLAGVLIGDVTMLTLGRLLGMKITKIRWIGRLLSEARLTSVNKRVSKYGSWIVFAARFMPGLRSPIFVVTGMTRRISYLRFILTDGCAALISVPVWVYLGFFGAQQRTMLLHWIKKGQAATFLVMGVIILFVVLKWYLHRRQRLNEK